MEDALKEAIKEYTNEIQNTIYYYFKNLYEGKGGWKDQVEKIELMVGRKYIRIVRVNELTGGKSAYGFIKIEDGTLWKAAGWKGPARNFSRGSVYDDTTWNANPFSV
jgi:hypothetical protein